MRFVFFWFHCCWCIHTVSSFGQKLELQCCIGLYVVRALFFFVLSESSFELEFDQVEHVIQTISQLPPYSSSFQCDKTTDKLFGGGRETSH